jgi:hypothetical protein
MTLAKALACGALDVPRADPLYGCRTASARSACGRRLYTVVETPIGERSGAVLMSDGQHATDLDLALADNLDWTPGTIDVQRFRRQHKL